MLINEGNEELLTVLISKYLPVINGIIKCYKEKLKDKGISRDEIYNDVIKAFINAIKNYNENKDAKFKTYINKVINNRIRSIISNKLTSSNKYNFDQIEEIAIDNDNPLLKLEEQERIDELINYARNNLSNMEYKVFILKINNISYKKISKILNKDIGSIYDAIYRIRCKMKEKVKENA